MMTDDTVHADVDAPSAEEKSQTRGSKRQMSTIAFPYGDLEDAVVVAEAVWGTYGGRCDTNQLAAALNKKASGGAFRIQLSTARIFGVITTGRDGIAITDLGRKITDDATAPASRAEAFLEVPLYRAIFDEVASAGGLLPDDAGLEDLIKRLGVVPTQADTARQVFQRSARQSGYNQHGPRRLVRPAVVTMAGERADSGGQGENDPNAPEVGTGNEGIGMNKPAIITELFKRLPNDGEAFPDAERTRWKTALEANLNLVYGAAPDEGGRASDNGAHGATGTGTPDSRPGPT